MVIGGISKTLKQSEQGDIYSNIFNDGMDAISAHFVFICTYVSWVTLAMYLYLYILMWSFVLSWNKKVLINICGKTLPMYVRISS